MGWKQYTKNTISTSKWSVTDW